MAVKTFEEIYSGLSAQEKTLLDNLFAKEPELKGGWLRQDDFSRRQTEFQTKAKRLTELEDYETRMNAWSEKANERFESLRAAGVLDAEDNETWTNQKTAMEKQLEEARKAALAGGDMKPEEIDERVRLIVKDAGVLTKAEIEALYKSETQKMVEEGFKTREADFNSKTIPFVAGFSAGVAVVANEYIRESGEPWTAEKQKELFDLMSAEQNFDPFKVKDKLLAPVKAKKEEEARFEARLKEELAKRGMPGGGHEDFVPQPEVKGALQQALDRSAGGDDFEATIKSRAVAAAKELRTEGKG